MSDRKTLQAAGDRLDRRADIPGRSSKLLRRKIERQAFQVDEEFALGLMIEFAQVLEIVGGKGFQNILP